MTPAISVAGLSRRYRGQFALDNVSFDIEAGSVTGLLGRNGAGKTTLLRVVAGHEFPSAGSLTVFGASPVKSDELLGLAAPPQPPRRSQAPSAHSCRSPPAISRLLPTAVPEPPGAPALLPWPCGGGRRLSRSWPLLRVGCKSGLEESLAVREVPGVTVTAWAATAAPQGQLPWQAARFGSLGQAVLAGWPPRPGREDDDHDRTRQPPGGRARYTVARPGRYS